MGWILGAMALVIFCYFLVLIFGGLGFVLLRFFVRRSVRVSERSSCSSLELYLTILAFVLVLGSVCIITK